jgi:hypothetical protein
MGVLMLMCVWLLRRLRRLMGTNYGRDEDGET